MRRRLTLAPAIKAKLRPRLPSSSVIKDSLLDADYTSARAELSAIVESVAAICSKPPAKHGMEFPSSKFWRGNMDSDESDEEVDEEIIVEEGNPSTPDPFAAPAEVWSPSTPELIAVAAEVGFSTQDLLQAEHELNEGTLVSATSSSGCTPPLAKRIISALVQHRVKPTPWRGQLPPPRVSPPRTLEDALEVAWRSKSSPCRSGSRHSSTPALLAGATSSSDSGSRVISKLPSVVGFGNTDGVPRITLGNSKSNLEQSMG